MNGILAEIYSTVIPSAPYIIAAYALVWTALLVWVFMVFRKQEKISRKLEVVEDILRKKADND